MQSIQSAVADYTRLGVVVLPVRANTKAAACSWKRLAASAPERQAWTDNATRCASAAACAVLLGPCSQRLAARDFDDAAAYERWADTHPDLARTLPTAQTRRGAHVYFRLPADHELAGKTVLKFSDGELRLSRAYVIAPPSSHPDGERYTWRVPIGSKLPPFLDPCAVGLGGRETESPETTESTNVIKGESTRSAQNSSAQIQEFKPESNGNQNALPAFEPDPDLVDAAIRKTQPDGIGQRNARLFDLVRELRCFLPPTVASKVLRRIVKKWHELARPVIGTKDFATTWSDFMRGWNVCHTPADGSPVFDAMADAESRPIPPRLIDLYPDDPRMVRLGATCYQLARRQPDWIFYLASRTASAVAGVEHPTGWRWMDALGHDGILSIVKRGENRPGGKATRYRYVGPKLPDDLSPDDHNGTPP